MDLQDKLKEAKKNFPKNKIYFKKLQTCKKEVLDAEIHPLHDEVFEKIDALALHEHVRHIQSPGDDELAHLYLSAGLLAMPSHYEGFGLPVLEAMHCRCPVVSSDRGSLPEVAGNAGLLLPPTEPDAWAAAMYTVLTDENTREMMKEAGDARAKQFSWARTAAETRRVYEQLV